MFPAELLGSTKLPRPNLPGSSGAMTFPLEYGPSHSFYLAQFPRKPTPDDLEIWTANGADSVVLFSY
jgi:hypothetical protein